MKVKSKVVSNNKGALLKRGLENLIKRVPEFEHHLNTLDSGCGDGDCGTTLVNGTKGMLILKSF